MTPKDSSLIPCRILQRNVKRSFSDIYLQVIPTRTGSQNVNNSLNCSFDIGDIALNSASVKSLGSSNLVERTASHRRAPKNDCNYCPLITYGLLTEFKTFCKS